MMLVLLHIILCSGIENMRIISKWKDYYDHIGHVYGGQQDNHVVYERKPISITSSGIFLTEEVEFVDTKEQTLRLPRLYIHNVSSVWLFVAVKSYLCIGGCGEPYYLLDEQKHKHLLPELYIPKLYIPKLSRSLSRAVYEDYVGVTDVWGERISKELNLPVFFYYQQYCAKRERLLFVVQGQCPVLADIGFPKIMSAEQAYQNIAFYIANTLTKQEQPIKMTDIEKVVSHGFDEKTSFRN